MRAIAPLVAVAALFAGLVSGCSKPVAPVTGSAARSSAGADAAAWDRAGGKSRPFLVRLEFEGPVVTLDAWLQPRVQRHARFFVYSDGTQPAGAFAAVDTVPAYSRLVRVRWARSLDDTSTVALDASAEAGEAAVVAGAGGQRDSATTFTPGLHVLALVAPERLGGGTVQVPFHVGFRPGAWWAGPDPARFPPSSDGDGRSVVVTNWGTFETRPAWPPDGRGYFGPDSFRVVPSQRRPVRGDFDRRTFYEIFGDRIYARAEGDTVHLGAWVVFVHAGYDRDSRYAPAVVAGDPALPAGFPSQPQLYPVLVGQGLIGSPSAFRSVLITRRPDGSLVRPSETAAYPNFDPGSVFRSPHVAGYWPAAYSGKAYAIAFPVDAEGLVGRPPGSSFASWPAIADRVDAGGGDERDRQARRQILTFHVRGDATAP